MFRCESGIRSMNLQNTKIKQPHTIKTMIHSQKCHPFDDSCVHEYLQDGDPLKRNENDAAALQAKIAAKKANQEKINNNGGGGGNTGTDAKKKMADYQSGNKLLIFLKRI